jgi:hypothetical protein
MKKLHIWQTVKIAVLYGSAIAVYMQGTFSNHYRVIAAFFSFWVCLFVGKMLSWLFDIIVCTIWNLERLGRMDEGFIPPKIEGWSPTNVQCVLTTTKFEFKAMQNFCFEEFKK